MAQIDISVLIAFVTLAAAGVATWIAMRERIVRAETKIEGLEVQHRDQKSEFSQLREWLEQAFENLRRDISKKVDRDK